MNSQFDFRALIVNIQDRLSTDDRHRLHFLVGDIIPRMQREDVTLGGTLTLFESLFDRAIINEDYMDFLIRLFTEIKCHDAVKRLQEFQLSKRPPQECKLTVPERKVTISDVLNDNFEEDKYCTTPYEKLLSEGNTSVSLNNLNRPKQTTTELETPNIRKMTTTESETSNTRKMTATKSFSISSETPNTSGNPTIDATSKQKQEPFSKFRLIYSLYILFFLQILALSIYLLIFIRKKIPVNYIEHRYHQDAYILKYGKFPDNVDGKWFNHSQDLSLTFADRLIRIDAYTYRDDIYSIKFIYSQNKSKEHRFRNFTRANQPNLSSLDFQNRSIQEITQCYKNNSGSTRLVGLFFPFKDKPSTLWGSCHEQIHQEDKFSNHIFGYAFGKMNPYLTGLQFIWYKICPLHNRVTLCTNQNTYIIPLIGFYKD